MHCFNSFHYCFSSGICTHSYSSIESIPILIYNRSSHTALVFVLLEKHTISSSPHHPFPMAVNTWYVYKDLVYYTTNVREKLLHKQNNPREINLWNFVLPWGCDAIKYTALENELSTNIVSFLLFECSLIECGLL